MGNMPGNPRPLPEGEGTNQPLTYVWGRKALRGVLRNREYPY